MALSFSSNGISIGVGGVGIDVGGGSSSGSSSGGSGSSGGTGGSGVTLPDLGLPPAPTPAADPLGLLDGLTMHNVVGLDLSLLGNTLVHGGLSLGNSALTLPTGIGAIGGIGGTEGSDIVHLATDSVVHNIALGGGADQVVAAATTVVDGTIDGGTGNDSITVGTGDSTLLGGDGNDTLTAIGTGNNILDGGADADVMVGGLGDDTYYVDNTGDIVTEFDGQGYDTVYASTDFIGSNTSIEKIVLTGAATMALGNGEDNMIMGNAGDNQIDGGAGADTLMGGAGNDTYWVDNAGDQVVEAAGQGTDQVMASVDYALTGTYVENLTLTGSALHATGNSLANVLTGTAGDNVLDGAGGADTMIGGAGNDTYFVDDAADKVTELNGQGTDTVFSSVSYGLAGTYVENLTLTDHAVRADGNSLANVLTGNADANVLNGGAGADTMIGGLGNDTYVVDNVHDVVTEAANAGTDLVKSSVSYALGDNVENISLIGSDAVNATGNALNNVMTGNSAANVLDGGIGADTMSGGAGNDTYHVDNVGDVIKENSSGGTDLVISTISYTLAPALENLTLDGVADLAGTGSRYDNVITGNAGNNVLSGLAGVDTLVGGAGDDVLVGGIGQDFLTGGSGADRFVFNTGDFGGRVQQTADDIHDFSTAEGDKIDLSGVDGDLGHAGQQHLSFIGSAAFTGADQVRAYVSGGNTYLEFNFDSQIAEDAKIKIDGVHAMTAADFLF